VHDIICLMEFQVFSSLPTWNAETLADAKHILTDLSVTDIGVLDLTDMVAVSALSEINWNVEQVFRTQ